ncbi:GntR family transcriptional regulator [Pedobacter sp. HMF7647]|uniref:GntR family transcriptional regulator n=1 Tax=Hufsiella arboris TaxID=2695275 RepID=A0A7K1Y556_9SPHI|nr:rhamnogalacturonan acetylesterase [Hufsiella arboris]MXV49491.1 GntR family transcriptional regulator [Hufsiella arboris]
MKFKPAGAIFLFSVLLLFAFKPEPGKTTVYLIGDSTMADKAVSTYPETGWGMPFKIFFDSTVVLDNRAKNGRSTKTFIAEKLWQPVYDNLKAGDYVFIQFGHNDEVPTKKSYTAPEDFSKNLVRFIAETREKKATPVLLSPVARRSFDADGKLIDTHPQYANLVREVAKKTGVAFIDLDAESRELLQNLGAEKSEFLFNHLAAGEHPNYPQGKEDNTHFNELGARKMAEIVLKDLINLHPGLENHIVKCK